MRVNFLKDGTVLTNNGEYCLGRDYPECQKALWELCQDIAQQLLGDGFGCIASQFVAGYTCELPTRNGRESASIVQRFIDRCTEVASELAGYLEATCEGGKIVQWITPLGVEIEKEVEL